MAQVQTRRRAIPRPRIAADDATWVIDLNRVPAERVREQVAARQNNTASVLTALAALTWAFDAAFLLTHLH